MLISNDWTFSIEIALIIEIARPTSHVYISLEGTAQIRHLCMGKMSQTITLSKCDHNLTTKCFAKRLTQALKDKLQPNQTAYLPGKQIQDHLRLKTQWLITPLNS
jgi:hypothetical protein